MQRAARKFLAIKKVYKNKIFNEYVNGNVDGGTENNDDDLMTVSQLRKCITDIRRRLGKSKTNVDTILNGVYGAPKETITRKLFLRYFSKAVHFVNKHYE